MKLFIVWLIQSFFYLAPIIASVVGACFIVRFVPFYPMGFVVAWVGIVSYVYVRYSKWV
ncbi:hypothetical protein [Pantoea ananatis]|uniref:hypothetical protein n=1 Tax=Pantoea ananas TaxID=553 RepID=UPI001B30E4EF|nr:hypothetical protein [Pantoea ananatis]